MPDKILTTDDKKKLEEFAEREIVDDYLKSLGADPVTRTADDVAAELDRLEDALNATDGIDRLELLQQREDLTTELYELQKLPDPAKLEALFVEVARAYADQAGISYSTFREFGVPKTVLEKAGIRRTRRKRGS